MSRALKRTTAYRPHAVARHDRADGSFVLTSKDTLGPVARTTGDWLQRWAREAPDRVFLAERSGGGWRELSYGEALEATRAVGAALMGRGIGPGDRILIMSGNGVDHGLLALAAQYIGAAIVPVAVQYALIPEAQRRLVEAIEMVEPKLAYVSDAARFGAALDLEALAGVEIVAGDPAGCDIITFDALLKGDGGADLDAAHAAVGPETVAKILTTSGSTSAPKGVLTTHEMMCVNQAQLAVALPFLTERPPRLVDWLPWNHVFGGSHNFNMALANGGSLYIDDGKPIKGAPFARTLENLAMTTGTIAFNVPVGFALLRGALEANEALRRRFFENLDMLFYAGASLPQDVWEAFERMAMDVKGEVPLMTSSWGLTETAPAVLLQQEPTASSGVVGAPMAGLEVKMIPLEDHRHEIRVRGPNVTPGYLDAPEKTADAFDQEGFFITGDAMSFVDPTNIDAGLRFEGRISEDFKLLTGTWVRATALRASALAALAPLAVDLVVTGHDRNEIGLLVVPNQEALVAEGFGVDDDGGALTDKALLTEIAKRLAAASGSGSSTRIARALIMAEPPSLAAGEVTAKGNLNYRKILARRADLLNRCYDDADSAVART